MAEALLADRAYDTNALIEQALSQGMEVVIPPKKNRIEQRQYDKALYKLRHLVENAFLHLKRWRGIATRYAKNTASFLAAVQIRCIDLWSKIFCTTLPRKLWTAPSNGDSIYSFQDDEYLKACLVFINQAAFV